MKTKQLIAFTRGRVYVSLQKPVLPEGSRLELLGTITKELGHYGYSLTPEALLYLSEEDLLNIHKEILPEIHSLYHEGEKFQPLYPGFPKQVLEKSDLELLSDRNQVYSGDLDGFLKDNPWYTQEEKDEIQKKSPDGIGKILSPMMVEEFMKIPQNIMTSGNSLHPDTVEELRWFLDNYPELSIPERIPFKETLCVVAEKRPELKLKDINDVLRYAFYKMGVSDLSLPQVEKTVRVNSWSSRRKDNPEWRKLGTLSRLTRKEILSKISNVMAEKGDYAISDAKAFYGHWVLLSERVHSGDYAKEYPLARKFFEELQGNRKSYKTWGSQLQEMYNQGKDILEIAKFVSGRPGEFIRRFDSFLRRARETGREADIMDIFWETEGMKNKTLLELLGYYDKRVGGCERLIKKPDGSLFKIPKPLEPLDPELAGFIQDAIVRKVLLNITSAVKEKDLIGKTVYLDPETKYIPVPKDMRSAVSIIPRGTKIPFSSDMNIIRFYVHWKQNPAGPNEDLDLHAFLTDGNGKDCNIGWNTGLKSFCAVHSGDVLDRPGDCAEYVDIDISKALQEGYRYVSMDVKNYKGRGFNTLPCWMGYMFPSQQGELQKGTKNWKPKDVTYCKELTSGASNIQAWIVDLQERTIMLTEASTSDIPVNNESSVTTLVKYFTVEPTFTTHDVLEQYYTARGATVVETFNPEVEIHEELLAREIILDYTKVLGILGE